MRTVQIRAIRGRWLAGAALLACASAVAAAAAGFLGRVAVEWDDTDLFNRHRLVLLADFGFQDSAGRQWIARKGAELDGSSFTPLFEQLVGVPFVGEHRRAGILHDYFAQQLTHDWQQVRRMYYEALLAEGLSVNEAKTAYAVLYGAGMRWEKKGSTCYVNCHGGATALRWKPDVTEGELESVFELLNEGNPTLDEIDRAVEAAVPRPGPHLFTQLRPEENSALRRNGAPSRQRSESEPAEGAPGDGSGQGAADDDATEVESPGTGTEAAPHAGGVRAGPDAESDGVSPDVAGTAAASDGAGVDSAPDDTAGESADATDSGTVREDSARPAPVSPGAPPVPTVQPIPPTPAPPAPQ